MTDFENDGLPQPPRPKPLSEMTQKERDQRLLERFAWDSADIVWEPHPDDVEDTPLTPTTPPV